MIVNQRFDQLEAWKLLIPDAVYPGNFRNTLRGDRNPSCYFVQLGDDLVLMDKAYPEYHCKNVVTMFMALYQLSRYGAIAKILSKTTGRFTPLVRKQETRILPFYREWNNSDSEFWGRFYLSKDDVIAKPIMAYIMRDATYYSNAYVYEFPSTNVKIYRPGQSPKFLGNVNREDYFYIEGDSTAFIGSSGKDCMVVHKHTGWTCFALQSEHSLPTQDLIERLKSYKEVIVSLDGDEPGVEGTKRLVDYLASSMDVSYFFCPKYGRIKDYADLIEVWGPQLFANKIKALYERRNNRTNVSGELQH